MRISPPPPPSLSCSDHCVLLYIQPNPSLTLYCFIQRKTAVTAYFSSNQLLLFASICRSIESSLCILLCKRPVIESSQRQKSKCDTIIEILLLFVHSLLQSAFLNLLKYFTNIVPFGLKGAKLLLYKVAVQLLLAPKETLCLLRTANNIRSVIYCYCCM